MESNFLLEIVRQQEECAPASELLQLARAKQLELAIPAFCLTEPYWTLQKDSARRAKYLDELSREVAQLRRSGDHAHVLADIRSGALSELLSNYAERARVATKSEPLIEQLREIEFNERQVLNLLVDELCAAARLIVLSGQTILWARAVAFQTQLTMQDSFVLASVMEDLKANVAPADCVFTSRDRKAFSQIFRGKVTFPLIRESGCKYIPSFASALDYIKSRIPQ